MRSQHTTRSPVFRSLAAGLLLVWVAAQALCFAHCQFGIRAMVTGETSAQTSKSASGGSCCPKSQKSSPSLVCTTLKSALTDHAVTELASPDLPLLYTLEPIFSALEAQASAATPVISRQRQNHDWVITPEVCLGPAHRSHAPPFLG